MLVARGLAESREKAQRLILAGQVRVNSQPAGKPGHPCAADAVIEVIGGARYVSRGGEKLEAALRHFQIDVRGLVCLDIGASTGGFTDCLLQHGAARVYAIDVGRGQLHGRLRGDPRVVALEEVNARYLDPAQVPERPAFAALDVSFISLTKVLPAVTPLLTTGAWLVTLIKPQFEAGRAQVSRGGVVRDPAVHDAVVAGIREFGVRELPLEWVDVCESPLKGPAGNKEFLAAWRKK